MACVIGKHCKEHGMVHGAEAEELRLGIEKIIQDEYINDFDRKRQLEHLLDAVDARDSLSWIEMQRRVLEQKALKKKKGKKR